MKSSNKMLQNLACFIWYIWIWQIMKYFTGIFVKHKLWNWEEWQCNNNFSFICHSSASVQVATSIYECSYDYRDKTIKHTERTHIVYILSKYRKSLKSAVSDNRILANRGQAYKFFWQAIARLVKQIERMILR